MSRSPPVWLIAGPTASGKSALAVRLAEAIGGEIVNADSMQIYGDLRVLTARPTAQEEARAAHYLYGVADAADPWAVGRWLDAAMACLARIRARRRAAIVVGGTGLYFRALTRGLAPIPASPPGARQEAEARFEDLGEARFRESLAAGDPAAEARIMPGDRQRLTRAWEVLAATGRSLSAWQAQTSPTLPADGWRGVVVEPPRGELYRRCDARLVAMLEAGALDEVRALRARQLDPAVPAMKAMGVRPLAALLAGETTLEAALAAAQAETRRYAKRQMTWFRGQAPDWPRLDGVDLESQWGQIIAAAAP